MPSAPLLPIAEIEQQLITGEGGEEWQQTFSYFKSLMPTHATKKEFIAIFGLPEEQISPALEFYQKRMAVLVNAIRQVDKSPSPKTLAAKLTTKLDENDWRLVTPALYQSNWRLHIDPKHQKYGPNAYATGNPASEEEFEALSAEVHNPYLVNMLETERLLDEALERSEGKLSIALYQVLHHQAMNQSHHSDQLQYFRQNMVRTSTGHYGHADIDMICAGIKQAPDSGSEYVKGDLSDGKEQKIRNVWDAGCFFSKGVAGWYEPAYHKIEATLSEAFSCFNEHVKKESVSIEAIATLYQILEKAHPYNDGNGRTNRALLNGLLIKNGFEPTILFDCACAHFMTVPQIVEHIAQGQGAYRQWQNSMEKNHEPQQAHDALVEYEQVHGIVAEYSLGYGEVLQQHWDNIELNKNHIIAVQSDLDNVSENEYERQIEQCFQERQKQILVSLVERSEQYLDNISTFFKDIGDSYKETSEQKFLRGKALLNHSEFLASTRMKNHQRNVGMPVTGLPRRSKKNKRLASRKVSPQSIPKIKDKKGAGKSPVRNKTKSPKRSPVRYNKQSPTSISPVTRSMSALLKLNQTPNRPLLKKGVLMARKLNMSSP